MLNNLFNSLSNTQSKLLDTLFDSLNNEKARWVLVDTEPKVVNKFLEDASLKKFFK